MAGRILDSNGDIPTGEASLWLKVIYLYGIPGALCLFLVYLLAINVPAAIADVAKDVRSLAKEHSGQTFYLRGICLNTARDETQRALCIPPGDK